MNVKDIMRTEISCLYVPGNRGSALKLIQEKNIKLIPILKKGSRKLLGIVTHQEIIKKPDEEDLAMLMNREPVTIQQNISIIEAIKIISKDNNRILVVLDEDQVVGLLTVHLIIKNVLAKKNFQTPIKSYIKVGITSIWDKTPLQNALYIMQIARISILPCIDDSGALSGVISFEEIMKESEIIAEDHSSSLLDTSEDYSWSWKAENTLLITKKHLKLPDKLVKDIMIKKGQIQSVNELTSIKECANKMRKFELDQLAVLDVNDNFIGMIYDRDLIFVLLDPEMK